MVFWGINFFLFPAKTPIFRFGRKTQNKSTQRHTTIEKEEEGEENTPDKFAPTELNLLRFDNENLRVNNATLAINFEKLAHEVENLKTEEWKFEHSKLLLTYLIFKLTCNKIKIL